MIRKLIRRDAPEMMDGVRVRGSEITRVEGFSDAVFAFALTLLVVSLEVPKSFRELAQAMNGFLAFGVCFLVLYIIWNNHYEFFRKYGLNDALTRFLNTLLLFVVLWYVFPLKFLFRGLFASVFGLEGGIDITPQDMPALFTIYSLGLAAVNIVFLLMYWRALRLKQSLELDEFEQYATRMAILNFVVETGIALTSVLLANLLPLRMVGFAGWIYFLFGPWKSWFGATMGRKVRLAGRMQSDADRAAIEKA